MSHLDTSYFCLCFRPMPTISWWKGGQQISQNAKFSFASFKKRLTVLNPGKSEEGFYECRATNPNNGQQISRRANLTIIGNHWQVLLILVTEFYKMRSLQNRILLINGFGPQSPGWNLRLNTFAVNFTVMYHNSKMFSSSFCQGHWPLLIIRMFVLFFL